MRGSLLISCGVEAVVVVVDVARDVDVARGVAVVHGMRMYEPEETNETIVVEVEVVDVKRADDII